MVAVRFVDGPVVSTCGGSAPMSAERTSLHPAVFAVMLRGMRRAEPQPPVMRETASVTGPRLARIAIIIGIAHLAAATITWLLVDSSAMGAWLNRDFERWLWTSSGIAVLMTAGAAAMWRSRRATLVSALGCLAALLVECSCFLLYAGFRSA